MPAAASEDASRRRVRLAQVMTGPRASCSPLAGDQTRKWSSASAKPAVGHRLQGTGAVEPGRRDEARDRRADHVFDELAPIGDALRGFRAGESHKLAFIGGHEASLEAVRAADVAGIVAVEVAVEEHLDAPVGPAPEPGCKRRARHERSVAPMIGNDQHRQALADMRVEQLRQPVYFAFEARRNVVDGRQKQASA